MERRAFLKTARLAGMGGLAATGLATTGLASPVLASPVLASPVVAQERVDLTMVTTWPRNFPGLGTGAQRFADRIAAMSDGRIVVTLYAAGELVGAFESFGAVSSGAADMYHGAEYYWKDQHHGFPFFTTVPMGLTYTEFNAWLNFLGGQELWDELSADFGIKGLMCGNTGVQMGGWFSKEINGVDDLRGLRMRMPGLGGDVLTRLGATPVSLPGGEIFQSLQSGAIDATEWVGPWNDLAMGFFQVASYYYYPGFHEPGSMLSCGINKARWDSFSAADQALITAAAVMENEVMASEFNAKNGDALATLVNDHGVNLRSFSDDIYDAFAKASGDVLAEAGQHSDLAGRILASFENARTKVGAWTNLSDQAYVQQRNRTLGV